MMCNPYVHCSLIFEQKITKPFHEKYQYVKQYGERFRGHLLTVNQERQMNIRQKVSVNKVSSQIQNLFCGIHVYHTAE
jgi:predicted 2-oxoglutarate/Fe(II)-dependent dioxygenase YbiX